MSTTSLEKISAWLQEYARVIGEHEAELTDLDREIGDGDHGSNMVRGMRAVAGLDLAAFGDAASYLKKTGMTLVSTVGGAAGPLYGTLFLRMAGQLGSGDALDTAAFAGALKAGVEGVTQRGKSAVGDKTMVDALVPAVECLEEQASRGAELAAALPEAAKAADAGREATAALVARRGRASYLGERSVGHIDPGAASAALLIESAARTLV
ncbi:dihydroxyacetone kinase, C-terminal domain [Propionibacterium cyclohexanicum]|uniref:Dihydroxyacetone kinase, C-terminal domain n=2 Tax=Propionibacterium cyclohexanicum TaxID=64702 RepID=A0A1H9TLY6_9ACTN|nr:dihydroxyacetone kinase, C-terminal domain [Propionibacterium cyclohexanicum]